MLRIFSVLLAVFSSIAYAESLGVIGNTYEIGEPDILAVVEDRFSSKPGAFDELNADLLRRSRSYVDRPSGVFLPRAITHRAVEISVEYTLDQDIFDADGKLLHAKGERVNPLDIYPLSKSLCFFDADDAAQVEWVATYCVDNPLNKLIAVRGGMHAVTEYLDRRVYFDQRGFLVGRFGIQAVPAVVRQSGRELYMEEFPVE